jgi:hypothetical protein
MGSDAKRFSRRITVLLGAVTALVALPAAAQGVERVADGNFESTVCNGTTCTSPAWTQSVSGDPGKAIGPLCADPQMAAGPASCAAGGLSGYVSPFHWARLGSSSGYLGGDDRPPTLITSITQSVLIPASPATLSFNAHIVPRNFATGSLRVTIDGQLVFDTVDSASGYDTYPQISVPVGFAAGPGLKELRFEGIADVDPGQAPDNAPVASDTFDVDNVSLDAPDPPATVVTPPPTIPTLAAPPVVTGQRAAALAKCKKKPKGPKRRACKQKANRLPI